MKKAIALIELIFAIIIIAITLLSVPNLLSISKKSATSAITQENISNGASLVSEIMSLYWDENDTTPNSPILYVKSGDSELNESKDTNGNLLGRRVGSNNETPRIYESDKNGNRLEASSVLGMENNDTVEDDIDDFNGKNLTLINHIGETTTADIGDFKDTTVSLDISVDYISDINNYNNQNIFFNNPFNIINNDSTNIKAITLTLTSINNRNKKIILKAFSCNIGASKLKERIFP